MLSGDPHQSEQSIPSGVGESRAHSVGRSGLADRAYRQVGGDPFSGGMGERCDQADKTCFNVDRGRLHGRDLVRTQTLAHDLKSTGERGVSLWPVLAIAPIPLISSLEPMALS
jgi:hypothetical protein